MARLDYFFVPCPSAMRCGHCQPNTCRFRGLWGRSLAHGNARSQNLVKHCFVMWRAVNSSRLCHMNQDDADQLVKTAERDGIQKARTNRLGDASWLSARISAAHLRDLTFNATHFPCSLLERPESKRWTEKFHPYPGTRHECDE